MEERLKQKQKTKQKTNQPNKTSTKTKEPQQQQQKQTKTTNQNMYLKYPKKEALNGIKCSLSPFLHSEQWLHQNLLLKHVSTLILFHNCDKKAWVGGGKEQSKKAWGGKR